MNVSELLGPGTDRSGSITLGGTQQQLAPANPSRRSLTFQNISAADLWINPHGNPAGIDTAGSYKLVSGAFYQVQTNKAVSVIGATTGQKFTATEV